MGRDDDLDAAIKSLTEYFAPAQNTDFEIFRFRQAKQKPQETLDNFHTRLRKLAQTCSFTTNSVDNEIKQQIIQGCSSSSLRKYALKTKYVKLQDILVKGKTDEIGKEHAKEIEKQTTGLTEKLQAMKIEHKSTSRVAEEQHTNNEILQIHTQGNQKLATTVDSTTLMVINPAQPKEKRAATARNKITLLAVANHV